MFECHPIWESTNHKRLFYWISVVLRLKSVCWSWNHSSREMVAGGWRSRESYWIWLPDGGMLPTYFFTKLGEFPTYIFAFPLNKRIKCTRSQEERTKLQRKAKYSVQTISSVQLWKPFAKSYLGAFKKFKTMHSNNASVGMHFHKIWDSNKNNKFHLCDPIRFGIGLCITLGKNYSNSYKHELYI